MVKFVVKEVQQRRRLLWSANPNSIERPPTERGAATGLMMQRQRDEARGGRR